MKLNHHSALRAIGGTLSAVHTCKEREYWTLPASLEDKDDFYNVRETIPFQSLLSGFRDAGFIVYLDKPKATDAMIAAAPELLAALEECVKQCADYERMTDECAAVFRNARSVIAKTRGLP